MKKPRTKHDMKALVATARDAVIKQQNLSYDLLCKVLNTESKGTIAAVIQKLKQLKVVAQNKSRRWEVLVLPDGSTRPGPTTKPKRRKIRRKRVNPAAKPATAPAPKSIAKTGNGTFTHAQELKKLEQILDASSGETQAILSSVVEKYRTFGEALKAAKVLS